MIYYFTGTAKWAKLKDPVEQFDKTKKAWEIVLYPDDASLELYRKAGIQTKLKEDADGTYVTFRRPDKKLIKGEIRSFEPPKVIDSEGKPLTELIGNGSTVTVKVEVYNTMRGVGSQLEGVRVDDLIPYEGGGIETPTDELVPF